jgi:hypothetical protein
LFQDNPVARFSDTEARLILDMKTLYDVPMTPVDKSNGKLAALQRFRTGVQTGRIVFRPEAESAIASVEAAVWNRERSGWARTEKHGHSDLLDAAIYANLMCRFKDCPAPPRGVVLSQTTHPADLMLPKHSLEHKRSLASKWSEIFKTRRPDRNRRR